MPKKDEKYIRPEMVRSPKTRLSRLNVLADKGEDQWSLAEVVWDGDKRLAVRWNGSSSDDRHSVGTPQSRGLPMWFILPDDEDFFKAFEKYRKSI